MCQLQQWARKPPTHSTDSVCMVILQELPTGPPQGPGERQRLPQLDEKESLCSSKSLWRCFKSPSGTLQWLLQCDCHQGQPDGEGSAPGADSQADLAEKTGSDEPAYAMPLLLDRKHHASHPGLSMKETTA